MYDLLDHAGSDAVDGASVFVAGRVTVSVTVKVRHVQALVGHGLLYPTRTPDHLHRRSGQGSDVRDQVRSGQVTSYVTGHIL